MEEFVRMEKPKKLIELEGKVELSFSLPEYSRFQGKPTSFFAHANIPAYHLSVSLPQELIPRYVLLCYVLCHIPNIHLPFLPLVP